MTVGLSFSGTYLCTVVLWPVVKRFCVGMCGTTLGYPKEGSDLGSQVTTRHPSYSVVLGKLPHGRIWVRIEGRQAIYVKKVAHEKLMRCMRQFSGRRIGTDRKRVAERVAHMPGRVEEKRIEEAN